MSSIPSVDLTELARLGKLDPVIGRDREIGRLINVLTRRTKNNPVLVGEAGVGKTAAVEGLASRMSNGEVPERLRGKRLLSVDLTSLVAGTSMRGQFEEKLKSLIDEVVEADGQIILFIDELHLIMGAGAAGDTALDVANVLKPYLARGTVQCIGATTDSEYSKHIEKDPALARRFQKVSIPEPTQEDTLAILRGLRDKLEAYHGIKVRDSALVAAVRLTSRYLPERRLPDKAIDLVDETASCRRTEIDSTPTKLREMLERIARLQLESASLKKDEDASSLKRLKALEQELESLLQDSQAVRSRWENKIESIRRRTALREQLETVKREIEQAKRRFDFTYLTVLETNHLLPVQRQLEDDVEDESLANSDYSFPNEINEDDIAKQLSDWTGIPLSKLGEDDLSRLADMETELQRRVIGQNRAITAVANAVRIARSGISDPQRPLATFLFLGPTGVGKTEVAKVVADTVFGDSNAFIRLDMSEFYDRYTVSRLVGSSPGYIGYEDGGQLTESVRRKPFSCVLFDELEKAHSDVNNILLQVLDEGRLSDGRGRLVDFKNAIIILTSNIGAEHVLEGEKEKQVSQKKKRSAVSPQKECTANGGIDSLSPALRETLIKTFRPELLNRIDEIVVFQPLSEDDLVAIVNLHIAQLNKRLEQTQTTVSLTAAASRLLAAKSYTPVYGVRPLRRAIRQLIEVDLAKLLLTNQKPSQITIDVDNTGNLKHHCC